MFVEGGRHDSLKEKFMSKSYSPEFGRRVVELCRSGRCRPRDVAKELDVAEATVCRWIAQDEVDLADAPERRAC